MNGLRPMLGRALHDARAMRQSRVDLLQTFPDVAVYRAPLGDTQTDRLDNLFM
jgi:hypothetical protein